jgi:hypothetical protein
VKKAQRKGHDLIIAGRVQPDVQIPLPYRAIIDGVAARDKEYFEQHPGSVQYLRAIVPGEFWGPDGADAVPGCEWVIVSELGPGLRTRRPLLTSEALT